jgi:hypothetical protein
MKNPCFFLDGEEPLLRTNELDNFFLLPPNLNCSCLLVFVCDV